MALLTGALDLPGVSDAYTAHRWKPRGWQSVDPAKESAAIASDLALGLTSRTRIAAERGDDFEELCEEKAADLALAASRTASTSPSRRRPRASLRRTAPDEEPAAPARPAERRRAGATPTPARPPVPRALLRLGA
jgi:capsid protein